jgi:uncharacterized membrane protein
MATAKGESAQRAQGLGARAETANLAAQSAKPLTFNSVFWVFVFGSFAGFVVETIYCLVTTGVIENRSGLLFAPFNVVYGIGAVVLYIGLHKVNAASIFAIFLFGMLAGTIVEFMVSWFQQAVFGSISWDYSTLPFNIAGRVSLLFAVFWGVLAVLWVKVLQPVLEKSISFVHGKFGMSLLIGLLVFLVLNMVISSAAITRWEERLDGIPATNPVAKSVDSLFPDVHMERIYPNLKHIK